MTKAFKRPVNSLQRNAGQFELEQQVKITAKDKLIFIEPLHKVEYSLRALLAGITDANAHPEARFGSAMGKEAL
jgi:antitoxin component of MazEF toxin-antitoxin module